MERARPSRRAGLSLVDVLAGLAVFALVALIAATYVGNATAQAALNEDRVFAYAKAQALLEELRAVAESGPTGDASELDRYDDGEDHLFTLTLQTQPESTALVDPDAAASGNVYVGDRWRFARRITVRPFPGIETRDLRIVTVRVFRHDPDEPPGAEVANLSTVVRTLSKPFPPSQVFDVYLVALENVPGWWVNLGSLKPFVEASLRDVMARNPGLELRTHWITKASYGRNPQYTPYFNEAGPSTDPVPFVYFYPGRMPEGSAAEHYYVPERVQARANVDGVVTNAWDADANPLPYTLADQWNHALRLPDEQALFDARVAAGLEDPETPTWRLFLERLNTQPERYRNAIVVNLHGELLPMPALRNHSDAAREPAGRPGVRVVTHPEKLRFARDTVDPALGEDVRLRVYTYKTDPDAGPQQLDVPVIVEIPGIDLTANVNGLLAGAPSLLVGSIEGGLDLDPPDGVRDAYELPQLAPVVVGTGPHPTAYDGEMYARVYHAPATADHGEATVIELHGSPLVAPAVGLQGLALSARLYGMEYVPCSTETANDFSQNLAANGAGPKNTARWVITIPPALLGDADRRIDVVTRIGSGSGGDVAPDDAAFRTGVMYPPTARHEPENVSRTYTWWAAAPTAVPVTERYQFQGDPRHCPYADLKDGGSSFPNGYNWFHDDFQNASANALSSWPGFHAGRLKNNGNASDDGWEGRVEIDVPRFFQLLRGGLVASETLYTSMTGWSYYYMGVGNEIGYDAANGFPSSIPVAGDPFGSPGTSGYEQSIIDSGGTWGAGVKVVRETASNGWWGIPWLGELYPDAAYATRWRVPTYEYSDSLPVPEPLPAAHGNLPSGSGSGAFRRVRRDTVTARLPHGTTFRPAQRRTQREGCTSFFNTGTSSATFHHRGLDGTTGDLSAIGAEVAQDFHVPLPGTTPVSRPFRTSTNGDGGTGDEFGYTADYPRFSVVQRDVYYGHSSGATGSALLAVTDPAGTRTGYQLVHGIDRTLESGSAFIARFSIATLVHGYLRATDPELARPLRVPVRVDVLSPKSTTDLADPATIEIRWRTRWRRWDDLAYTRIQTAPPADPESSVEYRILYSGDDGTTWRHVVDGSPAVPGRRPADTALLMNDAAEGGNEAYTWSTPSLLVPEGSYLLRVEAWRVGAVQHVSYHQERIFVNR